MTKSNVLVSGANGYVGSHILPTLLKQNCNIRAIVRSKSRKHPLAKIEYCQADFYSGRGLKTAFKNIDIAYYFIHSLKLRGDFSNAEEICANNFAIAAQKAQVKRIIYLSGLGHGGENLSEHLESRHAVGDILRRHVDDVVEFRASAILGAGSASYEMISALVEKLPFMILPKWVFKKTQPIGIRDVLYYLSQALDLSKKLPEIIEIGGISSVTYQDMMLAYAKERGLKRVMIPVPFLSLNLSSLWLFLFTPLQARVGKNIISSLVNETIVKDNRYLKLFNHKPKNLKEIFANALNDETCEILSPQADHITRFDKSSRMFGCRFGRYLIKREQVNIHAKACEVFSVVNAIGGKNGWYYLNSLWRLRAFIDLLLSGPGNSHGKSTLPLEKGDYIDAWEVEAIEPEERLLLSSIMKMPGDAYLEFEIIDDKNFIRLYQTAFFRPKGLIGSLYWTLLYPIHQIIFKGMLKQIKKKSEGGKREYY